MTRCLRHHHPQRQPPVLVLVLLVSALTSSLFDVASTVALSPEAADGPAQKVSLFIDLEKVNYYRGVIRQLVKLDDEVACLRPDLMTLRCPERTQIYIQSATLKRPRTGGGTALQGECPISGNASLVSLAQSQCRISRALQVVKLRCEERQQCRLVNPRSGQQSTGPDPYDLSSCEQLLPHLQVRYTCEPTIRTRFLCADTYSTIGCDDRQKLMILDAVLTDKFMFQDERCPNTANPEQGVGHCPDSNIFDDVKRQCDSKTSCTIGALHSVKPGCARPNMLLLYACVPKKSYDQSRRTNLPASDREKIPTIVYSSESDSAAAAAAAAAAETQQDRDRVNDGGPAAHGYSTQAPQPRLRSGGSGGAAPSADAADAGSGGSGGGISGGLSILSGRQLILVGSAAGGALLLLFVVTAGCLATRSWLRSRRRREEEHLARVNLSKQIPPPATCLLIPPAETLLKLPSPNSGSQSGCGSGAQTVSVCLSQLGSPPCSSVDGSSGSDRQSSSATSTFLTGSAASRAGSLPSPRESLATYSVHQHHCTTSVLEEFGHQQLGMI